MDARDELARLNRTKGREMKLTRGWAVLNWRGHIDTDGPWQRLLIFRSRRSARVTARAGGGKVVYVEIRSKKEE